jgi:hypothetical protein
VIDAIYNVEALCQAMGVQEPPCYDYCIDYGDAVMLTSIDGHFVVNPLKVGAVERITHKVRFMTTTALLEWLSDVKTVPASQIRAAILWLRSFARHRSACREIKARDGVIDSLQTELANNIDALQSATRALDHARRETRRIAQEKDREITMYQDLLQTEEDAHAADEKQRTSSARQCCEEAQVELCPCYCCCCCQ